MSARLAPYALDDAASLGRAHRELFDTVLPAFELDRRRVQASAAFRRLQYKTQVFVSPRGDHYRTRLTHTLEVAAVARQLAGALRVSASLAEVVALTHDLGHPPFGHAGEAALNRLMQDHGGFEHNAQSYRVVSYLEHPFPPFRGLNLTCEVREALLKHRTRFDQPAATTVDDPQLDRLLRRGALPPLEGQVAALADRLAYNCHDLEDALGAELIAESDLAALQLWERVGIPVRQAFPMESIFAMWRPALEQLQQHLLSDAVAATTAAIENANVQTADQVRLQDQPLVCLSAQAEGLVVELESFLLQRVYRHPQLRELDQRASRVIVELFESFVRHPQRLPPRFAERVAAQGTHRVVCDYIAGMTDRYCEGQFRHIMLPFADRP